MCGDVMKRTGILITLIALFFLASFKPVNRKVSGIKTVVIDAGHGGHDVGCLGSTAKEKNIALNISLKLGDMIEKKFPDVRVIYTRKKDEFVELNERAGIANRAKADLFICIHCNSACVRNSNGSETCNEAINGIETYVMGLHKTEDNLAVSRRENASILLEKDYKTKYDGFDPNSPEANIIFTLFQNAYMSQSISFASKIQSEIEEYAGRSNRGVKQAGFLVLYRTAMPSVLIETGFLTSPSEQKYLLSEKGQTDVASSIFRAFKEYKIDMEGESSDSDKIPEQGKIDTITRNAVGNEKPKEISKSKNQQVNTSIDAAEKKSVQKDTLSFSQDEPIKINADSDVEKNKAAPLKDVAAEKNIVFYTVQIGAAPISSGSTPEKFKDIEGLKKITGVDGMTRFTVGQLQDLNEAISLQTSMRNKGFKDAFVTAYQDNRRITLQEAAKLLKKN
jgi:N-acetylmuramoyl-L-alanine amidase